MYLKVINLLVEKEDIKNLVYRIRFVSCYSPSLVMNLSDAILLNLFLLLVMVLLYYNDQYNIIFPM